MGRLHLREHHLIHLDTFTMAFMNRASLHLALYESAYATTAKVVETTVSKIPEVGFKILAGHVERVTKNIFSGDGTKSAREHIETNAQTHDDMSN